MAFLLLTMPLFWGCDLFKSSKSTENLPPELTIYSDTTLSVNDSINLSVQLTDEDSASVEYIWQIDELNMLDTLFENNILVAFPKTGTYDVIITAIDNKGSLSDPDTLKVTIFSSMPSVQISTTPARHPVNDTLKFTVTATDTDGKVIDYLWSFDNNQFNVTKEPMFKAIWSSEEFGSKTLYVKVIDDDSLTSLVDSISFEIAKLQPQLNLSADTSIFVNDSISFNANAIDSNGTVVKHLWSFDNITWDTTSMASLTKAWPINDYGIKILYAKVIDDDGIESSVDSTRIEVLLSAPIVKSMSDTSIFVNDSINLNVSATDVNGTIFKYLWSFDNVTWDTTSNATLTKAWVINDYGNKTMYVKVIDDDGVGSTIDSTKINVTLSAPVLIAMNDTIVAVNDSILFTALATDNNGNIINYLWSLDSGKSYASTMEGAYKYIWPINEYGSKLILVKAMDDDNVESNVDTIVVTVNQCLPEVQAINLQGQISDTIISINDSIYIGISATDSNGQISKYYWDFNADGWDDSTSNTGSLSRYLKWPAGGNVKVVVGALDDDGLIGLDTFNVLFNRPPTSCDLNTNFNPDKGGWSNFNYTSDNGSIQVSFTGVDPDGGFDVLSYDFYWGLDSNGMTQKSIGMNGTVSITDIEVQTTYYWKVIARDLYGDSTVQTGLFSPIDYPLDGIFWNNTTGTPNFTSNFDGQVTTFSHDGQMWLIAAKTYNNTSNMIYNSADGINWVKVTGTPNFTSNFDGQVTAFSHDGQMWLVAAKTYSNTSNMIFKSADGINWVKVTGTPNFTSNFDGQVTAFSHDGQMWLVAAETYSNTSNMIFKSTDGINWVKVTGTPNFASNFDGQVTAFSHDGQMWLVAAETYNNTSNMIYKSTNGINWVKVTGTPNFTSNFDGQVAAFSHDGQMWLVAAKTYSNTSNTIHKSGRNN
ncbi:MAG: hypothetical protein OCC49_18955 [Fibrobacterales bacterium]